MAVPIFSSALIVLAWSSAPDVSPTSGAQLDPVAVCHAQIQHLLDPAIRLARDGFEVRFVDYDWDLNGVYRGKPD